MTDCDDITPQQADTWHRVSMRHLTDRQMGDLLRWLETQPGQRFYWTVTRNLWFESELDAALCVMSWL
jgi:hypothetical protein